MDHTASALLIPAATLVIFRHGRGDRPGLGAPQVLMIERAATMRFAAGASVFPGGRVDASDRDLARAYGGDAHDTSARIAAIRETLEETGLLPGLDRPITPALAAEARRIVQAQGALAPVLDHVGARLDLGALVPFAHWRQSREKGFDTRFYLTDLGSGRVDLAADATETTRLFWTTPADALRAADSGRLHLIFPTRRNLERLAQHASFAQARADAQGHPIAPISARREQREGVEWLTIPDGLGYPVLGEPLSQARRG